MMENLLEIPLKRHSAGNASDVSSKDPAAFNHPGISPYTASPLILSCWVWNQSEFGNLIQILTPSNVSNLIYDVDESYLCM